MKIVIFTPQKEFSSSQVEQLQSFGEVVFTPIREGIPLDDLIALCKGCDILGYGPDNTGGFEKAPECLQELLEATPTIQGLALDTTAFHYVNHQYCKENNITVANVPGYSAESVAEHVLGFMLGASKRIFVTDRATQKGNYQIQEGFELRGRTLGVIGLGSIGTRVAELGNAVDMKVIAYNRSSKKQKGVQMVSIEELLAKSDVISLNLATNAETQHFLSAQRIALLKKGVIITNTADRALIDEKAMAKALQNGTVDTYVLEAEDFETGPLAGVENAIFFKGFGWYTKDALARNKEIWVQNIVGMVNGEPENVVEGE